MFEWEQVFGFLFSPGIISVHSFKAVLFCIQITRKLIPLSCSRQVFPNGLPEEYCLVATFRIRRNTKKERWYIWQVLNQYDTPEVRVTFDLFLLLLETSSKFLLFCPSYNMAHVIVDVSLMDLAKVYMKYRLL